ncbi:MAG TPA: hypothetical protein VK982_12580 [Bacteroidales bacterium]|nr:hypothetical protein [Bacteroidales bacterium]
MKYIISYLSDNQFVDLKEISEDEYSSLKNAREFILFYYGFEELFDMVRVNIYEFWQYYFEICEKYRLKIISRKEEIIQPISFFNQRLATILTSFRSYDDHMQRKISNSVSSSESVLEFYRHKFSEFYDKDFSFRFFAPLRNYVQHYGYPFSKIRYNSKIVNDYDEYSVSLLTKKQDLLEFKKWSTIKTEIQKMDDEIDIPNYLNQFLHTLSSFHKVLREYFNIEFTESSNLLNDVREMCIQDSINNERNKIENLDIIYINSISKNTRNEMFWLPFSRLSDIQNYFIKNQIQEVIKKSYSTNKLTV